jgi:hypothetical protein
MRMYRSAFGAFASGFPLLIIVAAVAIIIAGRMLGTRIQETETHTSELTSAAMRLEQALGYGGFIHNFKNYVLRPADPTYRHEAEAALAVALEQIDTIERLADLAGSEFDLAGARRVLLTYAAQIAVIGEMAAAGAHPREIDATVRVDDTDALEALTDVVGRIERRYSARHADLSADLDRLGGLFLALALMVYASLGCQLFRSMYGHPIGKKPSADPDRPA